LRDAESCGTYRSVVNESLELIDSIFDFDQEIFGSKVYRMATRSSMKQALLDDQNKDEKPITSSLANVTSPYELVEDDGDESDKETISERPVEIYRHTYHPLDPIYWTPYTDPFDRDDSENQTTREWLVKIYQHTSPFLDPICRTAYTDLLNGDDSNKRTKRECPDHIYRHTSHIPIFGAAYTDLLDNYRS
jgi:hypothetical protein